MQDKKIAVLIPCYNEGQTIGKVVGDFRRVLPQCEVYVYDNNSTDNTLAEAREAGATVRHEARQGKGNVVRQMLRDIEADCYLLVDGDDTYPAESAPEMCKMVLEDNYDMVIGDRISSTYAQENKRPLHDSGNRLVCKLINCIFGGNVKDVMTGYRALSRQMVTCLPLFSTGFEIETELTINALEYRYSIGQLAVSYRDRPTNSVSKLSTFRDGIRILHTIFVHFRNYRPLLFFSLIAALLVLVSSIALAPVLSEYLATGLVPRFPTLIVCGFVYLLAILLLSCGIVLDVLNAHHRQLIWRMRDI